MALGIWALGEEALAVERTPALVAVSRDLGLQWNALAPVTMEVSWLWSALHWVHQDRLLRWRLRLMSGYQLEVYWGALRAGVVTNVSAGWSVYDSITFIGAIDWSVYQPLVMGLTPQWQIHNGVSATQELSWIYRSVVASPQGAIWRVRSQLGNSSNYHWSERELVDSNSDALWGVFKEISTAASLEWTTLSRVFALEGIEWGSRNGMGYTSSLLWDVLATALTTSRVTLNWGVRYKLSQPANIEWQALTTSSKEVIPLWGQLGRLDVQMQGLWEVLRPVSAPEGAFLRWNVRAHSGHDVRVAWTGRTLLGESVELYWTARRTLDGLVQLRWVTLSDRTRVEWGIQSITVSEYMMFIEVSEFLHRLKSMDLNPRMDFMVVKEDEDAGDE